MYNPNGSRFIQVRKTPFKAVKTYTCWAMQDVIMTLTHKSIKPHIIATLSCHNLCCLSLFRVQYVAFVYKHSQSNRTKPKIHYQFTSGCKLTNRDRYSLFEIILFWILDEESHNLVYILYNYIVIILKRQLLISYFIIKLHGIQ